VLVVDDKGSFLALFRRILPADTELVCASDGVRALELLSTQRFDVVVTDVRMPGGADGIEVLKKVRASSEETAVILMTAYGSIAEAVRAMKYGADDYLTKPFDPDDALAAIERAIERRCARSAASGADASHPLLGDSQRIVEARDLVGRAARSDDNVFIYGETGTGKDVVASWIHQEGRRRERPFVVHLTRSSSESRLEADLERAAGGSLYIDEAFELPGAVQARLSQWLEQRERKDEPRAASARIIASSSIDVTEASVEADAHAELGRQLARIRIELPALRVRSQDIPALAAAFLGRMPHGEGAAHSISSEALDALIAYEWPGNIRQLEAVLLGAVSIAAGAAISVQHLPAAVGGKAIAVGAPPASTSLTYREVLAAGRERTTRDYLVALLTAVGGNVTHAAERAGVERETFHRLIKRHGVRAEDFRTRSG
jgi:two-component system response regulator AtoC